MQETFFDSGVALLEILWRVLKEQKRKKGNSPRQSFWTISNILEDNCHSLFLSCDDKPELKKELLTILSFLQSKKVVEGINFSDAGFTSDVVSGCSMFFFFSFVIFFCSFFLLFFCFWQFFYVACLTAVDAEIPDRLSFLQTSFQSLLHLCICLCLHSQSCTPLLKGVLAVFQTLTTTQQLSSPNAHRLFLSLIHLVIGNWFPRALCWLGILKTWILPSIMERPAPVSILKTKSSE